MNVLNDYTRVKTQLVENLSLKTDDDSKLSIVRAGNSEDLVNNPDSVNLYNIYSPQTPTNWSFSENGEWKKYCNLNTVLPKEGTYIIQIIYGCVIYSGIFAYNPANPNIEDEIILHSSGNLTAGDKDRGRLYAKTAVENNTYVLQLANKIPENQANQSLTIKFRQLL